MVIATCRRADARSEAPEALSSSGRARYRPRHPRRPSFLKFSRCKPRQPVPRAPAAMDWSPTASSISCCPRQRLSRVRDVAPARRYLADLIRTAKAHEPDKIAPRAAPMTYVTAFSVADDRAHQRIFAAKPMTAHRRDVPIALYDQRAQHTRRRPHHQRLTFTARSLEAPQGAPDDRLARRALEKVGHPGLATSRPSTLHRQAAPRRRSQRVRGTSPPPHGLGLG